MLDRADHTLHPRQNYLGHADHSNQEYIRPGRHRSSVDQQGSALSVVCIVGDRQNGLCQTRRLEATGRLRFCCIIPGTWYRYGVERGGTLTD